MHYLFQEFQETVTNVLSIIIVLFFLVSLLICKVWWRGANDPIHTDNFFITVSYRPICMTVNMLLFQTITLN